MKKIENVFTKLVLRRLKNNKNCIIFIVGSVGEGKSYAGLKIYENLCKVLKKRLKFGNITFNPQQFLRRIKEYSEKRAKYEVILFDEAGVGVLSRRSMTNINVLMGTVAQSCRYMLGVIIITVPDMSYVDSQVRGLTHYILRTQSVNTKKKYSQFKVYKVEKNPIYGKVYYKRPLLGGNKKLNMIRFSLPAKEIIDKYETIKEESFKKYYKGVYEKVVKEMKDKFGLTPLQEEVVKLRSDGLMISEIAKKMNRPVNVVSAVLSHAGQKIGKAL